MDQLLPFVERSNANPNSGRVVVLLALARGFLVALVISVHGGVAAGAAAEGLVLGLIWSVSTPLAMVS